MDCILIIKTLNEFKIIRYIIYIFSAIPLFYKLPVNLIFTINIVVYWRYTSKIREMYFRHVQYCVIRRHTVKCNLVKL